MLHNITPVILTYNEEANIERTLNGLWWAKDIVIVDSYSSDLTCDLIAKYSQTRPVRRRFDNHATQWNFAIEETGIATEWILALDADYLVSREFAAELATLRPTTDCSAYRADFTYCVFGRPLRGTLYPGITILFRAGRGRYRQAGHTQRLEIKGTVENLREKILHDDRKTLSRWLVSQQKYAALESNYLVTTPLNQLRLTDRIRRMGWPAPFLVCFYVLFAKGCVFDGWSGWFYVLQRFCAETLIALEVVSKRLARDNLP